MTTWNHVLRAALAALALGASSVGAQAAEPRSLRLGIGLSADSPKGKAVVEFGNRLSSYTNGSLRVELIASGKAGNDVTMVKALQDGTLEMTAPDTSTLTSFDKGFSAINYPFTFLNEREADTILDGAWGQKLLASLPAHGIIGLTYWENGFRQMTNNKRPINTPEDLKGLKMRTMENPIHIEAYRQFGIQPTPMAFTEVYTALQQGTVDGQENPLTVIQSAKLDQVQKNLSLTGHVYSPAIILMNKVQWDRLSAADKDAFLAAAREAVKVNRARVDADEKKAVAELRAKGMIVVENVDKAKFQAALAPVYVDFGKRFGQDNIDRIRNYK